MTFKELVSILKQENIQLANQIRALKAQRKQVPNGYVYGLLEASHNFRIQHIAYCLLRGKTFEQIENKWRNGYNTIVGENTKAVALILLEKYKQRITNEVVYPNP